MAAQKRVDNKRRILKEGESQLPDGRYRYRYFDMDGCRQVVYSWKLVERDRMPPGKKDDLSLREKERQIERDMEDSIKTGRDAKITLNQMFETYMTLCAGWVRKENAEGHPLLRRKSILQLANR